MEKPGNNGEQTATRRDTKSVPLVSEVIVFLGDIDPTTAFE
jgi:hypothetical protein